MEQVADVVQVVVVDDQAPFRAAARAVVARVPVKKQRLGATQLHDVRLGLDRHHTRRKHAARRRHGAVGDGAGATKTAAEQTAERGCAKGRGQPAQLPAAGLGLAVKVGQADAGHGAAHAIARPAEAVERTQVQQQAAVQRHDLAVVAGARTTQRDGHTVLCTRAHGQTQLVNAGGAQRQLGHLALQLALEHGAEPREVLRQARELGGVGYPGQLRQGLPQGCDGSRAARTNVHAQGMTFRSRTNSVE